MTASSDQIERLIHDHLEGRPVQVPAECRQEFDQAVAAHAALQQMLAATAAENAAWPADRGPPEVSSGYEIERELGRGGMGVVYLARQRSLNRRVALKVLRPGERVFGPLVQRFRDEAQHLAQLRHPHIVSIHEVGDAAGEPYFTMDYIEGESLAALISRGPLSPTQAVAILKQVAAAIQHAHQQGIIHRDLKPANVLIDQAGQAYVTDFGLARNIATDSNLTQSGELLGTPQYMSPEQARGQTTLVGEATDIHALGLLLHEMLSGKPAFGAASPAEVLVKLLHEEPPALRTADRRIPRDLETICQKALQKDPAGRYRNVSALVEDLRRYEAGEPLLARRTAPWTKATRWAARHWKLAAAVAVTALLVALIAPRLFDKSFEDLVAWGDEELRAGRPDVAAQVFERAWDRSQPNQREIVAPKFIESVKNLDDPQQAVDLALKIVEHSPQASFGKYDFLVAQSLVMTARAETTNGAFEPGSSGASPQRALAAQRLSLFLDGPWGTARERSEAEQWLNAIQQSLAKQYPTERWSFDEVVQLPDGSPEELLVRSADASLPNWNRGKAAMAAGRHFEAAGDTAQALAAYQAALELMRPVYPFVSGVASEQQAAINVGRGALAPECRLMDELLSAIRKLEPKFETPARGGIRLSIDQPELLDGVQVGVTVELCDPAIDNPYQGLSRELSRHVAVFPAPAGMVKVLNGTYRLRWVSTMTSWQSAEQNPQLLEIAAKDWPKQIEIRGEVVDLPVAVRKLQELTITSPAELARVDLLRQPLAWQPIPGAASYVVQLGYFTDTPAPTTSWFTDVTTTSPSLNLARLTMPHVKPVQEHWTAGRIVGFRVNALDAAGQRIGTSLRERRFLVAAGLSENEKLP